MLKPKLVWTSALLLLGGLPLEAQTTPLDGQTNLVDVQTNLPVAQTNLYLALTANFRLTATVQATPETITNVTITSRDLIQAIGAATGTNFSPHARLVLLFRDLGGVPFFVIRDGTNELNAAEFLTASQNSTPLVRLHQSPKGLITGTLYCEEGFRLENLENWDFEVQGFNVAQQSNHGEKGDLLPVYGPTSLQIRVNGPGTVAGNPALVQGLVVVTGRKLELRVDEQ